MRGVGGEGRREQQRRGGERKGVERSVCKMEEPKEGAREELFFFFLL